MIDVLLPYSKAMMSYYCRESPWKEIDEVNHSLVAWLDELDPEWDWGFQGDAVWFRLSTSDIATLFKLRWG